MFSANYMVKWGAIGQELKAPINQLMDLIYTTVGWPTVSAGMVLDVSPASRRLP